MFGQGLPADRQGPTVMYRPLHLSPRQGTLLGLIWIAVQQSRGRGEAAIVESKLLRELIFIAQNRGLIRPAVHFPFDRSSLPELDSVGLGYALEELQKQGFLHVPETGSTIGFLGTTFGDLPTGIFRHIDVFKFAELVDEFTGGRDDE